MCTAINFGGVFGRTFDYEYSFGEQIVATPREKVVYGQAKNRYAMLGVGVVRNGVSLYFDGVNEWGLCGAALNFPNYAVYHDPGEKKAAISSGSLVGFLLGFCKDTHEVRGALENIVISKDGESTPLHWIFADKRGAITIESVEEGLKIYDNPLGVLTNSPDFPTQLRKLEDYMHLSPEKPNDNLTDGVVSICSRGIGGVGLPGDFSSSSRFVRALFLKKHTICESEDKCGNDGCNAELSEVRKFFRVAASVTIPPGSVLSDEGLPVSTRYTSCVDMEGLAYYLTSHRTRQISCVKLLDDLRDGDEIRLFSLYQSEKINLLN